jgi:hypothetical protein
MSVGRSSLIVIESETSTTRSTYDSTGLGMTVEKLSTFSWMSTPFSSTWNWRPSSSNFSGRTAVPAQKSTAKNSETAGAPL